MDRLQTLRVFHKVVDEGSFAAAARALDLSPAVVTRLVADLEDSVGARLLHRTTRRVSLTTAGESLVLGTRHVLVELDEAFAQARCDTAGVAGTLRLHTTPVLAEHILAPVIASFRELHPDVTFAVEVSASLTPAIEGHDLLLVHDTVSLDADAVVRRIWTSDAVVYASPAYLRAHGVPRTLDDLAHHAALVLKKPGVPAEVWHLSRGDWPGPPSPQAVTVRPVLVSNHVETLLQAALSGAGLVCLPVDLVARHVGNEDLQRVLAPWTAGTPAVYAVLPSRKFLPARTRAFLDHLVAANPLCLAP